jgi:Tol biopolymer transport system component
MGEVYRARDAKLNRDIAIKVLLPAVANDPDRLARFSREAQVLASLNHPNIAAIYGIEEASGTTALVMELVEGEDLSQRIARGAMPIDEALPIARQIAEALEAAHDLGIIHRDLKPANIKVRADGTVKVLDFGLAKAVDPTAGSSATAMNSPTLSIHATQAGIILGTAAYMSPEQARGKSVDKRTDIWALGCVLFEMLTGKRAFPGDDATDTIVAVVSKEPDWNALPANVPTCIRKLLGRCVEKDPRRRLDSAAAVRIELDDTSGAADVGAMSRPRVAWLPWTMAALFAVLCGVFAFMYLRQEREPMNVVRFGIPAPFGFTRQAGLSFSLSPDGASVAFSAMSDAGTSQIFVRRLDQTEPQPVPGTLNASQPFWSPNSRSLGFSKDDALYRTDLDGTAPRRLCPMPGGTPIESFSTNATWSQNGTIVFAPRGSGLFKIADSGGAVTPVTALDETSGEYQHGSPSFLPDGQRVMFLALSKGGTGVIWAVSLDGAPRTRLAESNGGAQYANGYLLTTAGTPRALVAQPFDAAHLAIKGPTEPVRDRLMFSTITGASGYSVSSAGTLIVDRPPAVIHQLTWVDRVGRIVSTVGPAALIREFAVGADETVVASVTHVDSSTADLWRYEPQRRDGHRLTFQAGSRMPVLGPRGDVYFRTRASQPGSDAVDLLRSGLRSLAPGAADHVEVPNPGGLINFHDMTSDGRYQVLTSPAPRNEIWIQAVGQPDARRLLVKDQFAATQARVSADRKWLAFTLALSTGPEVFVQPFDRPGARVQVSRGGGAGPVWRADGRELFYESPQGLMALTIADRGSSVEAGIPERLFPIRTQGYAPDQPDNFGVAGNGQKFLINTVVGDTDNAPLEVTLNWTAGLKK